METKGAEMAGKDGDKPLRRVISMLLSLAMLAERASGTPWPIRCLVLWVLRHAEAAASGYVREVAQMPFSIVDLSAFPDDNSPHGALRLAMCFRALAVALRHMLRQPQRFAREIRQLAGLFASWGAGATGLTSIIAGVPPVQAAAAGRVLNDTS